MQTTALRTIALGSVLALSACNNSTSLTAPDAAKVATGDIALGALQPANFLPNAITKNISTVDCTLSSGLKTSCYSITIAGVPADAAVGPFCPTSIETKAEDAGIWLDGSGNTYNADGDFIVNLPTLYQDEHWQLYDPATGKVKVTTTQAACEAAARPQVDPAYQNYCVQCSLDYVDGGVEQTFLIPVTPVRLTTPDNLSGDVGVSLNGVALALAAPVDAILGAYTIAAFDDCGGHVNPHEGYHYHAATGCTNTVAQDDGHSPLMAYARDGYGIYALANANGEEHQDLDQCRGTRDDVRGYHYHAASPGENKFIGCFHGDTVEMRPAGPGPGGPPPPGGKPPPPNKS